MTEKQQLKQRRVEKAGEELKTVLLSLTTALKGSQQPTDKFATILTMGLRAFRLHEAISLLSKSFYWEEMAAVTRTLIEVVTNACYLQNCPDEQEFKSFRSFDMVKNFALGQKLETKYSLTTPEIAATKPMLVAYFEEAKEMSKRTEKHPRWSAISLGARAVIAEAGLGFPFLTTLVESSYEYGNPFIHGTFSSLDASLDWLSETQPQADNERIDETQSKLVTANNCLLSYCQVMSFRYGLDYRAAISVANSLNQE